MVARRNAKLDLPKYESSDVWATTLVGICLSLEETRAETIKRIVDVYRETRSFPKTAEFFQITTRTLANYRARLPELQKAIEAVQKEK